MALKNYGVLKGRAIDRQLGFGRSPHYQVRIVDDADNYRIAINVKSKLAPSELLYLVVEDFDYPFVDDLRELPLGFNPIARQPGGMAMDYIRANLFDPQQMVPLPHDVPGPDNDLNEKIDYYVQRAIGDPEAIVYAFGERWGPETHKRDKYFGFKPGNGIHDIHMNQGSEGRFAKYNGVWQDGGMLIHFGDSDRWVAFFLAFQSQCWHTDEAKGNCLPGHEPGPGDHEEPVPTPTPSPVPADKQVVIIAAKVNPAGHDPGRETVLLLNTMPHAVELDGWSLADKNKKKQLLSGSLEAGQVMTVTLTGDTTQLSNKGGIITLLNRDGLKVHGVQYTKKAVSEQGRTIVF